MTLLLRKTLDGKFDVIHVKSGTTDLKPSGLMMDTHKMVNYYSVPHTKVLYGPLYISHMKYLMVHLIPSRVVHHLVYFSLNGKYQNILSVSQKKPTWGKQFRRNFTFKLQTKKLSEKCCLFFTQLSRSKNRFFHSSQQTLTVGDDGQSNRRNSYSNPLKR